MRWVFDSLFADAGTSLSRELTITPADVLASHAWRQGGTLDLFADIEQSVDAIGKLAGAGDARGYREFCSRSERIYRILRDSFIGAARPTPLALARRIGFLDVRSLLAIAPFRSLWSALGQHFADPRLRQLFGRYATYVGSSPLQAPATLMLIAHVEQDGVWLVQGGMHAVARALERVAVRQGATFRYGADVTRILVEKGRAVGVMLADGSRLPADAVVFNGDANALAAGFLGDPARRATPPIPRLERSLSAITWCLRTRTSGFRLTHHNVFFAEDYPDEFDAVFRRRSITSAPTVYLCAQDRGQSNGPVPSGPERLLLLVNAPADGDQPGTFSAEVIDDLQRRSLQLLSDCGLTLDLQEDAAVVTTPRGFDALFPATGGALYGQSNHGAFASFARAGSASRIPGLYLAGGSVHPGAGVPMATMSGRLAAAQLLEDLARR
jgi:1-hydroxycarotenoid 3,4-desaturase